MLVLVYYQCENKVGSIFLGIIGYVDGLQAQRE